MPIYQSREYNLTMLLDSNKPAPLIVCLHGGLGNADSFKYALGISNIFSGKAIIAYLNATLNSSGNSAWNSGGGFNSGVDDVGYIESFVNMIKNAKKVTDVYIVGHSNGAMMGYRMLIERPSLFKGLFSMSGDVMVDNNGLFTGKIKHIHGSLDENVPLEGGIGINGFIYQPVENAVYSFANAESIEFENGLLISAGHPLSEIKAAIISEKATTLPDLIHDFVMG